MSTIVTRAGKGSPLTHNEVDANFTNLNTDKIESGNTVAALNILSANIDGGTIDNTAIGNTTPNTGSFTQVRVNQSWDEGTGRLQVTGQAAIEGNAVAQDVIVQGGNNLLQRSAEFDNASWTKSESTVTSNAAVSPDGTTTADKLIPNSATINGRVVQGFSGVIGATYTISIYAKAAEFTNCRLYADDGGSNIASVSYDLSTGLVSVAASVSGGNWTNPLTTSTAVGNSWYRLTLTWTANSVAPIRAVYWCRDSGNGTSGIFIWGAQAEAGTVASPYTPTTSAAVTTSNDLLVPSGNVGIGTSNPAARLHVTTPNFAETLLAERTTTGTDFTATAFRFRHTTTGDMVDGFGSVQAAVIRDSAGVDNTLGSFGYIRSGADNTGAFILRTSVAGTETERFRISAGGTVIIGNGDTSATPANGTVSGTNGSGTNITGATLTIQGGRGTGTGAGGPIVFSTSAAGTTGTTLNAATERMRVTSAGDIGIGLTAPGARLHVRYGSSSGNSPTNVAGLFVENDGTAADYYVFQTATTGGGKSFSITNNGNVGIGTTSPGAKLDVSGTLRLSGSTSGYVGLAPAAAAGSTTYTLPSADGTNGQALVTNGSGVLSFATVSGGGGAPTTQTYDTGTGATWTKPASANWVTIEMWGGGGSGGCGQNNGAGGGGGGGAYTSYTFKFSDLQGTVTYTVGSGGTSQSTQNAVGNAGGTTSVTLNTFAGGSAKTIYAYGGGGGGYNGAGGGGGGGGGALSAGTSGTNATNGGAGGSPNAGLSSDYGGGTGGSGVASSSDTASNGGSCLYGGGGGGGAQDTTGAGTVGLGGSSIYGGAGGGGGATAGTPGAGGTSTFGGNGGAGAIDTNAGTAGTAPAGGGGGTEGGASGAGAAGRVRFTYW